MTASIRKPVERLPTDAAARILKAAEKIFSEQGFDRARVDDIARQAGVNKALIYYYYRNKEAMLEQMVERIIEEGVEQTRVMLRGIGASEGKGLIGEDAFKNVAARILEFLEARREVLNIVFMQALKKEGPSNPLFRYLDHSFLQPFESYREANGLMPKDQTTLNLQFFYLGFLPLLCFVLFNEKWSRHYDTTVEAARARFLDRYYHEFYVDTFTRLLT